MTATLGSYQASRSEDFVQSIGVTTHLNETTSSFGNVDQVIAEMNYLGVQHARDRSVAVSQLSHYIALGKDGVKFDIVVQGSPTDAMPALDALAPYLATVEGPNEVDRSPVTYNGVIGPSAAVADQAALYSLVHSDPTLNGPGHSTPVLAFSLAPGADYSPYGDISAYADYKNVHAYGSYGGASHYFIASSLARALDTPNLPAVITETGNFTMPTTYNGLTQDVQAKLEMDDVLLAFQLGVKTTYLYELSDPFADPNNTNYEDHWGMFNADGTPKLAATAFHNMLSVLSDTTATAQSFTTAPFTYGLANMPYAGNEFVMEKSNGAYDIAIWQEPEIWNYKTLTEITFASTTVTVNLSRAYQTINVYDPLIGSSPIATYHNVSTFQVALNTGPLIVEVERDATGQIISTGSAGGVFASTGMDTVIGGSGAATVNVSANATITGSTGALTVNFTGSKATLTGGAGALTVTSNSGSNTIAGSIGAFSYTDLAANDLVTTGSSASNKVVLGSGNDTVTALGIANITGGSGTATIILKGSGASVTGGSGALTVSDNGGSNTVTGGAGAFSYTDTVGNDLVTTGTSGSNKVVLGGGNDTVNVLAATILNSGISNAFVTLNSSGSSITGGSGTLIVIDVGTGSNTITGGAGAFSYTDIAGNDTITTGSSTNNKVVLGSGSTMVTTMGATTITGGPGAAIISINAPGTSVTGGAGALSVTSSTGNNTVVGGTGAFSYTDTAGNNMVTTGKSASNKVALGSGSDTVSVVAATLLTAGAGASKLTLSASGSAIIGGAGVLTIIDNKGANTITGGTGALAVTAYAGGDSITTNNTTGTSTVILSVGSDTVVANGATNIAANTANLVVSGSGAVSVNGGTGAMTVTGGSSSDYIFTQNGTKNLINLGSGADTVLSHGADTINASASMGAGVERIYAGGAASITGGAGMLMVSGQGGPVTVKGGTGAVNASTMGNNSYLQGGSTGGNVLNASSGNSTLVGGGAGDRLTDTGSIGGNFADGWGGRGDADGGQRQ